MLLKAIAFDWGHTVMNGNRDGDVPVEVRPIHVMPGVSEVLPHLAFPLALWANTRLAKASDVRAWLERAGLDDLFRWVITSVDAGARKPAPRFFEYALAGSTPIGSRGHSGIWSGRPSQPPIWSAHARAISSWPALWGRHRIPGAIRRWRRINTSL